MAVGVSDVLAGYDAPPWPADATLGRVRKPTPERRVVNPPLGHLDARD
jgi:hypothetical protein